MSLIKLNTLEGEHAQYLIEFFPDIYTGITQELKRDAGSEFEWLLRPSQKYFFFDPNFIPNLCEMYGQLACVRKKNKHTTSDWLNLIWSLDCYEAYKESLDSFGSQKIFYYKEYNHNFQKITAENPDLAWYDVTIQSISKTDDQLLCLKNHFCQLFHFFLTIAAKEAEKMNIPLTPLIKVYWRHSQTYVNLDMEMHDCKALYQNPIEKMMDVWIYRHVLNNSINPIWNESSLKEALKKLNFSE